MAIQYLNGDATAPVTGTGIIAHVCNNAGGWGAGFVLAISKRWKEPERKYRAWAKSGSDFKLGKTDIIHVSSGIAVANMVAQDGYGNLDQIPLKYDALEKCLEVVGTYARVRGMSVHMPRIGCSLAGGKWSLVEPIVSRTLAGLDIYVYDFAGGTYNK